MMVGMTNYHIGSHRTTPDDRCYSVLDYPHCIRCQKLRFSRVTRVSGVRLGLGLALGLGLGLI